MPMSQERITDRLVLTPPASSDVDDLYRLNADPAVWEHLPTGRHSSREQTAAQVQQFDAGWREHGLDVWVARPRTTTAEHALIGIGGCSLRGGLAWNLYYRLAPRAWGYGYAQELIAAAREAAAGNRPGLPVVAYLLEHNTGSRQTAERAGLRLVWRGPDEGNPDPAAVRLVYADRPIDRATLTAFTGPDPAGTPKPPWPRRAN